MDRLSATATPTATAGDSANSSELMTAKGPVLATAIIAGVMAAKKTSELIPFCHPVPLHDCQVTISRSATLPSGQAVLQICCTAKTVGKTGVEMEALVGATNAALCVYDMLKAWSHEISIQEVVLLSKTGGKSGTYSRIGDTNSDNREE